jgi:signal transduction histidine kinase
MTIRTRLTLWYAVILFVSLLLIGGGTYREIREQSRHSRQAGSTRHDFGEAGELVVEVGLPAVLLGLAGGWWLTRRALAPVAALTQAAQRINECNLSEQLPRTGNADELDRLTEVFNAMTTRLDNSFQRIREFTLHASHELKTPLAVMHGELETALQDQSVTDVQRERLFGQLDEVQRLAKIVDGLTLLAKADSGQVTLNRELVRLDALVRDNFADAQILAEPSRVQVQLASCEKLAIRGDQDRLRQLLLNLADNAVKYNQPQGQEMMALERAGEHAEFVISNTGPGIAPESLPLVFDRFFRGDPAHNNSVEGCGLGLSIAQWIVSAHNGSIQLTSSPFKLTTVTVRLPLCGAGGQPV